MSAAQQAVIRAWGRTLTRRSLHETSRSPIDSVARSLGLFIPAGAEARGYGGLQGGYGGYGRDGYGRGYGYGYYRARPAHAA